MRGLDEHRQAEAAELGEHARRVAREALGAHADDSRPAARRAAAISCLNSTLSMHTAEAVTPEPT